MVKAYGTARSASTLPQAFWSASNPLIEPDSWLTVAGLKGVVSEEGVWRIRRREKDSVIEVFKLEETGHGDILSPAFVKWRTQGLAALQCERADPDTPAVHGVINGVKVP
jgi:hypothetical protein